MEGATPRSYRPLSIAAGIRAAMHRDPDKVALTCGAAHRSYRQLVDRIDRVTALLIDDLDVGHGQHGAILAPNCLEYLEIVAGAAQAGVPLATVNPKLSPKDAIEICDDAEARVIFASPEWAETLKDAEFASVEHIVTIGSELDDRLRRSNPPSEFPQVQEWETFTIPYTSGTTGRPKGVLVPHRSRILTLYGMGVEYGCFSPDDRFLAFAPICHGAGMVFALAPVYFGGHAEILPKFDPEHVLERLSQGAMSGVFMVPTHFHGIFDLPEAVRESSRPGGLRTIISNAAPLPQATKEQIVDYFGEGLLHETYGSTEAGIVTNLRPADQLRKKQCVGLPFTSTLVKLLNEDGEECAPDEVGELFSASPYLFNGYWNKTEETEAAFSDGWVSVGDLAKRDSEGYIYIVDRKKDMVITGGVNVYPREIEEVLMHHPDVLEAAVIGVPDEKWGEQLKAFVAIKSGAKFDLDALANHCTGQLARFKVPKLLEVVPQLPRNSAGKVLKNSLRDS